MLYIGNLFLYFNVSTPCSGFVIYFSYGIRNSSEAGLAKSDIYVPTGTSEEDPVTPEKEAFLHTTQHIPGDDDDDDDEDS